MKRLNYYQVHKNKQPKKLKFQTIRNKHDSFVISVNTKNLESAMRKASRSMWLIGRAIVQFENN